MYGHITLDITCPTTKDFSALTKYKIAIPCGSSVDLNDIREMRVPRPDLEDRKCAFYTKFGLKKRREKRRFVCGVDDVRPFVPLPEEEDYDDWFVNSKKL